MQNYGFLSPTRVFFFLVQQELDIDLEYKTKEMSDKGWEILVDRLVAPSICIWPMIKNILLQGNIGKELWGKIGGQSHDQECGESTLFIYFFCTKNSILRKNKIINSLPHIGIITTKY